MKGPEESDRPNAGPGYRRLIADLAKARASTLGHLDPAVILVISGAARGESRASIRPLSFGGSPMKLVNGTIQKPPIEIGGRLQRYEICLRPGFFLSTTPTERLKIFAHELWHIAQSFDGTLDPQRRHGVKPDHFEEEVLALVDGFEPSAEVRVILEHRGELTIDAWLSRPPSRVSIARQARAYSERDLYSSIQRQR